MSESDQSSQPEDASGSASRGWFARYVGRFETPAPMAPWLWLSVLVIVLDQATKAWADSVLYLGEVVPVMPGFNIRLAYNHGAAFSFLGDAGGWQRWLFIGLAVVVSMVLLRWLRQLPAGAHATAASFALILGGAIGNLIDRISTGYVVDFVDWYVDAWGHWPTFNIADSALSVGVCLMLWMAIFRPQAQ